MKTKPSTLAGSWYPGDAVTLRRTVDLLLAQASGDAPAPQAAIVPHAGYQYSGAVAAAAYRLWQSAALRHVVILAPSHRAWFAGVAIPDFDAFETPLGVVRIDVTIRDLCAHQLVRLDSAPFHGEHSLEIQLPFLQRVAPDAQVLPLLLGDFGEDDYGALVPVLDALAAKGTAFVISSDLTHFGRSFGYEPFAADAPDRVRARLRTLDFGAITPMLHCDASGFSRYVGETGITVCGRVPVQAFLTWAATHQHRGALLAYQTSLDVTGDYEHTVSYAAIAFAGRAGGAAAVA